MIYSPKYGCNITDRAQRGEYMEVDFWANTAAERANRRISRCWYSSKCGHWALPCNPQSLDAYTGFNVPTNPACDESYVNITTASGTFSKRIPVGTR